jgi:aspartate/methionine/tyrosine aminotransferase
VTIPGVCFGRTGEGYLRLSYGAATQERLQAACGRIADFFGRSRRTDSSDTIQVS